jgi:CO/xanthine dehydrogenase Mo-binding subunit
MTAGPMVEFAAGRVRVRTGKVELGQGLHAALAQIVADELGVPMAQVDMLPVDTDSSPDQGVTSGSQSVQEAGRALREACAALRPLAARRAEVGRSMPRAELEGLFAGASHFIHDLQPEGLLHGRVLHPPHQDAPVLAWDEAAARSADGLVHLQRDGRLFGLLSHGSPAADQALARLAASVHWGAAEAAASDRANDLQQLRAVTRIVVQSGAAAPAARTLNARYSKPWIAHASLAPSCALARWADGRLRVWSHSQGIFNLQRDLALAFGTATEAVRVTHVPGAGCYGHNGADDVAFDAAWLARSVPGRTVRVVWTRADELTHSPFGPAMVMQLRAGLDGQGRILDWQHEVWSPGHSRRPGRDASPALLGAWQVAAAHPVPPSIDMPLARGGGAERNAVPGYDFAALDVRCHTVITARRSSALRSLGAFGNVFAAESFIDEIAHATACDPLALRRRHLQHDARGLAVLDAAAARAGWSSRTRSEGCGHGIGYARYKGTGAWCAVVAEVHAAEVLRVRRLTIAVDVGLVINPDGVINQIEGGAVQATSWTLKESAQAAQAGWGDYPILRFSEVPAVDVVLMPSEASSLGAGEASIGPTGAAIANALFDALGVRVRELPLTPLNIMAAMDRT